MIEGVAFVVLFCVALVGATVVHEGGHWVAALMLDGRPKVLCLGSGRQVFQMRMFGGHLVLREIPLGGRVMILPMGRQRRNAMAAFIAAGPAANFVVAVAVILVWCLLGDYDMSGIAALAVVGAQTFVLASSLPMADDTPPDRSDGAMLRAWARGRDVYLLDKVYASLVAHLPADHRPARTADFAEVLFQSIRSDRHEPWGRRQAIAGLEAVLERCGLNPYERMATLKRLLRYHEEVPLSSGPWGASRTEDFLKQEGLRTEELTGGMSS